MELDYHDLRMLNRAMKSYGRDLAKARKRNEASGWSPEPGKGDRVSLMQTRYDDLDAAQVIPCCRLTRVAGLGGGEHWHR